MNWKKYINEIINIDQRQDSLLDQLKDLCYIANKLKFYDAEDYLKEKIKKV